MSYVQHTTVLNWVGFSQGVVGRIRLRCKGIQPKGLETQLQRYPASGERDAAARASGLRNRRRYNGIRPKGLETQIQRYPASRVRDAAARASGLRNRRRYKGIRPAGY
ncbi:uncharacterized protein LOC123315502 [Coccinella septempunctata]|uniref:uncharacterized protein LOC123315502 n=1 Tax=Coccinella septempunctata TaxID=41139 RepID=UPI001D064DBB|nr:uncharacterized protein LOC123315502 [Coccinella septempunctata]